MTLLKIDQLCKRYAKRQVVSNVTMLVEPGEIVGLLGANGAGKSTTFRMALGIVRPDKGRILFQDKDITTMPMHRRARLGLGYLAQEPTVFANLTVAENILLVLQQYYPRSEHEQRLQALLNELSIGHLRDSLAGSLSGGERRRLEITRSLVVEPRVLFFDEPFAGVDPKNRSDIRDITEEIRSRGISVLITDHHAEAILRMVDRLYVMENGTILASGTPEEIVANQAVRQGYLGDDFEL